MDLTVEIRALNAANNSDLIWLKLVGMMLKVGTKTGFGTDRLESSKRTAAFGPEILLEGVE
jgi:hypothetical protein